MNQEDALDNVTEIEVSNTEKRQLEQYQPATAHVSVTATVGEEDDPEEVRSALQEYTSEKTKEAILERVEEFIRKDMDDS